MLWYHLLALWRDNHCLEGPKVGSRGPVTLNLWGTCWLFPMYAGFFISDCSAYVCGWEDPVVGLLFSRPKGDVWAYADDVWSSLVLVQYVCDCQRYLARFEVSFRVELICCNGPFWLYPIHILPVRYELVDIVGRWCVLVGVLEALRCACPTKFGFVSLIETLLFFCRCCCPWRL